MEHSKLVLLGFIVLISAISIFGLKRNAFFERYQLDCKMVKKGNWYRLFTSGFLHVNIIHLIFNMLVLYTAGITVSDRLSWDSFLILYVFSLIIGNILSFLVHINDDEFRLVGASGAVYGILFSAIMLSPEINIALFSVTWQFPTWILAIVFFIFSFLGMIRKKGTIAHEAHWGGAFVGVLITVLFYPEVLNNSLQTFIWFTVVFAMGLVILFYKTKERAEHSYKEDEIIHINEYISEEDELNLLLDKMKKEGYERLSSVEKQKLYEISEKL